jgi:benzoyl-CoA reductase subunit C
MAEFLGATLVIGDRCTSTRYSWNKVIPDKDRLMVISDRYCDCIPCPTKDFGIESRGRDRFKHILELAKDYRLQDAVLIQKKCCGPHECDILSLRQFFEKNGTSTYSVSLR